MYLHVWNTKTGMNMTVLVVGRHMYITLYSHILCEPVAHSAFATKWMNEVGSECLSRKWVWVDIFSKPKTYLTNGGIPTYQQLLFWWASVPSKPHHCKFTGMSTQTLKPFPRCRLPENYAPGRPQHQGQLPNEKGMQLKHVEAKVAALTKHACRDHMQHIWR